MSIYNPKDDDLMEIEYDMRHGGPYDRGSADAYYGRSYDPHYFKGGTNTSEKVELKDMTAEEIVAYTNGYKQETGRKDWGYDE